jgi:hypothetical protein
MIVDGIIQPGGPVLPYQTAFSDAHWHVEDMIAEGDVVVTRWYGTGVQDGDLPRIPVPGRRVHVSGIWWQRLKDEKIVESRQICCAARHPKGAVRRIPDNSCGPISHFQTMTQSSAPRFKLQASSARSRFATRSRCGRTMLHHGSKWF